MSSTRSLNNLRNIGIVFLFLLCGTLIILFTTNLGLKSKVQEYIYLGHSSADILAFGMEEYECSGSCYCDIEGRRNTLVLSRGVTFFVASLTSLAAFNLAKKQFQEDCVSDFRDSCDEDSILAEVDDCWMASETDEPIETKILEEDEGIVSSGEEIKENEGKNIFNCEGSCMLRGFPTMEDRKHVGLTGFFGFKLLSPMEGLRFISNLRTKHECSNFKFEKIVRAKLYYQAYEKFLGEMIPFCMESAPVEAKRKDGTIYKSHACDAFIWRNKRDVGFPENPSIHCRKSTESGEEGEGTSLNDITVEQGLKIMPRLKKRDVNKV